MIYVNDSLRVRNFDNMNITVERKKTATHKDGSQEEYWAIEGYYPSVESAFRAVLRKETSLALETATSINELIEHITKCTETLRSVTREYKKESKKPKYGDGATSV